MRKKKIIRKRKLNKDTVRSNILRRSLFYGISLFATFQFLLVPLQRFVYVVFWVMAVSGFAIVLLELAFSIVAEYRKPVVEGVQFIRKKLIRENLIHHLLIPSLLYISGVLFLFFNRVRLLDQVAVVILSLSFFFLFYNIAVSYQRLYSIARETRYVFDFVNIVVFYFLINSVINLVLYSGVYEVLIYIAAGLITLTLIAMMVFISKQFNRLIVVFAVISALFVALVSILVFKLNLFNITIVSIVISVAFYLVVAYWHHKLEGTFNKDTMFQYVLFAIMAIILLLYL